MGPGGVGPGGVANPGNPGNPEGSGNPRPAGQGAPLGQRGVPRAPEHTGATLSGTVLALNSVEGRAQVMTERGVVSVRGRPAEIAIMAPQDRVFLRVTQQAHDLWIEPAAPLDLGTADVTMRPGTGAIAPLLGSPIYESVDLAQGTIQGLNVEEGIIAVDGHVIFAHPAQLRDLEPGQLVSVSFGTLEGRDWAGEVRPGIAPLDLPEEQVPFEGPLGLEEGLLGDVPALGGPAGPLPLEQLEATGLPDPEPSAVPQIVGRGNNVYLLEPDLQGELPLTPEADLLFEGGAS